MKNRNIFALLCVTVILLMMSGCGDKVAEDLANQLVTVANSYQEQVDRTNAAERKAYRKLASIYVEAQRNDVLLSLEQERIERAGKLADETAEVKKTPATLSEIQSQLRDYANFDFENTRKLMKEESEARAQYLAQLARLNDDSIKVEALSKSLAALAKSKSRVQQVKEVASFFEETKKEVDKLFCQDATEKIKELEEGVMAKRKAPGGESQSQKAMRVASLEALTAELDGLKKQKDAKKCN